MFNTLEELIQNRKELIDVHRKNNFTNGIHALLTDLYPDTAHFIYELLQNAEDMDATIVRFTLDENNIDFEHNGTKRSFNIDDINAITNIGDNNQKKDETGSIGKFGVGFKSVFAYTSTPIIHSGDYHFKIRDYFVPEFHDVDEVSTIDNDGVAWTKFSFPFNNPKKAVKDAFNECLKGLKSLDHSAVLFLRNIKKIEYMLPSCDFGYVELIDNGKHHITVTYKKANDSKKYESSWMRFDRMEEITDDHGKLKMLPIAIAFSLGYDEKTNKEKIVPVKDGGRTFIYFPAEKEYSGLRFHINAPFASTVARDSVKNCKENIKLIKAISELMSDSLAEIKTQGLMNHYFFEVLPNGPKDMNWFYQQIWDYIEEAFKKNEYLPTKYGGYVSSKNAIVGRATIADVLKKEDMQALFNIDKTWIKNAAQKNSNVDKFIRSLEVQDFSFADFTQIFEVPLREKIESLLKTRQNDWLKQFYVLCSDVYDNLDYSNKSRFIQNMKVSKIIRGTNKEMYRSSEIFILPPNVKLITKSTPIVEQDFVLSSNKNDKLNSKISEFFKKTLDIKEYGPNVEIKRALEKYEKSNTFNKEHFDDLLHFAEYKEKHNDIDFSNYEIFLYLNKKDNNINFAKASELFLGKTYQNDVGEVLASAYNKNCLWDGYAEHYNKTELDQFVEFVKACGINDKLIIEKRRILDSPIHPLIKTLLASDSKITKNYVDEDYTISNIEDLLKIKSFEINKHIWNTLKGYGNSSKYHYYHLARYAPNGSANVKKCDSSLIYYLKEYAWIPNKQMEFFKPADIVLDDLHDDFVYYPDNKLLVALEIGSSLENKIQEQKKLEEEAKKVGMHLISDDDFKEYQQWKSQKELTKNIDPLSARELLKKQQKRSVSNVNAGDDFSTDGAVNNISRRETNIEVTFRNAKQMKPAQRELFGRVVESTKEEKNLLRNWYQGKCQMCNTVITGYNQVHHFIAKNIINTKHLSASIRQTTHIAWNSLCLCPNCAAKYDVCSRDINNLYEQIMQTEIIEGDSEPIILSIILDEKEQNIRYIPKHFLALKKVLMLIDDENN